MDPVTEPDDEAELGGVVLYAEVECGTAHSSREPNRGRPEGDCDRPDRLGLRLAIGTDRAYAAAARVHAREGW